MILKNKHLKNSIVNLLGLRPSQLPTGLRVCYINSHFGRHERKTTLKLRYFVQIGAK